MDMIAKDRVMEVMSNGNSDIMLAAISLKSHLPTEVILAALIMMVTEFIAYCQYLV